MSPVTRTPPDYRDRNLQLGARRDHLEAGQRGLFVDDCIDTGGQAIGARSLVDQAGAM
jgi:adenine phosphoribosyltransferase